MEEPIQKYPQQVDYKELIKESVQANIINKVKNQLPKFLPKAVSDRKNALEKTPFPVAQSFSQAQSSLKVAELLSEYELKTILFEKMDESCSYQTHEKNQAIYDDMLNSLILDDDIARGQADVEKGKKTKRRRTKESEPSKKSSTSKEPSKDNDAYQPLDDSTQTKDKAPKQDWFEQPPRPPTPDTKWNKRQVVLDQPEHPWFNQMVSAAKDPLSFDELMTTPIDFSNNIELEYNMQECFKALTKKLDWNNTEGDRCPFDLTKPLPLKGSPGRLTIAAEYFFNNDLEFLKSSDPEKKYITYITKTKVARYEIVGIEDMVPMLWSSTQVGYNKDAEKEIKHWGEKHQLCVSVKKLYGYGHLEEIAVRRVDRKVYKFKEGDFVDLHLNDIEDMLLLTVQHKLFQIDGSDIVNLISPSYVHNKSYHKTSSQGSPAWCRELPKET
ncbi:hypothetical protein Tco_1020187 [Tanacetum coccineum]|uniref:Uncharacterized protein n=1 Tax=Tanacetum coccineum TaxID=301880 RepID=A0ABQ5G1K3_9ASTR